MIKLLIKLFGTKTEEPKGIPIYNGNYWRLFTFKKQ